MASGWQVDGKWMDGWGGVSAGQLGLAAGSRYELLRWENNEAGRIENDN